MIPELMVRQSLACRASTSANEKREERLRGRISLRSSPSRLRHTTARQALARATKHTLMRATMIMAQQPPRLSAASVVARVATMSRDLVHHHAQRACAVSSSSSRRTCPVNSSRTRQVSTNTTESVRVIQQQLKSQARAARTTEWQKCSSDHTITMRIMELLRCRNRQCRITTASCRIRNCPLLSVTLGPLTTTIAMRCSTLLPSMDKICCIVVQQRFQVPWWVTLQCSTTPTISSYTPALDILRRVKVGPVHPWVILGCQNLPFQQQGSWDPVRMLDRRDGSIYRRPRCILICNRRCLCNL